MIYYLSCSILWLFFKICFRYRVRGGENIPAKGPFIIASNHLSFLDPAAVGLITKKRVSFLARESLFNNGLFAIWARAVGVIPIQRGRFDIAAIKAALNCLRKGGIVALFPEGTRSRDGAIKDPKAGVGFMAMKAGVPVVPVFVKGSDKALPPHGVCIRFKRVEVTVAEAVMPQVFSGKNGGGYRAFSQEVMRRIERFSQDAD